MVDRLLGEPGAGELARSASATTHDQPRQRDLRRGTGAGSRAAAASAGGRTRGRAGLRRRRLGSRGLELLFELLLAAARRRGRRARAARRACRARRSRPSSSTRIWSASRTVLTRCETSSEVRPSHLGAQLAQDRLLGLGVDARQAVVEHQDRGASRSTRAGERGALALAARERDAALADQRVVARREAARRPRRAARRARPRVDRSARSARGDAEGDVVGERRREQERVLRHVARSARAAARRSERAHVEAVEEHGARRRVEQRAAAARAACSCPQPVRPTMRERRARRARERHVAQRRPRGAGVAEREVAELDRRRARAAGRRASGAVCDRRRGVEDLGDAAATTPRRAGTGSTTQPSAIIGQSACRGTR